MNKKNSVWAHSLVKNEERWIWFSLQSILNFADKILVWDTGSTDKTVKIIKSIKSKKIKFKRIGNVSKPKYGKVRQRMLKQTKSDWVFILDGDEIWPNQSLIKLKKEINAAQKNIQSFCVRPLNFVGDINYIHPETFLDQTPHAPKGLKGFFSTRVFKRNIKGLHIAGPYGKEGFYNHKNITLREDKAHVKYLKDVYYWHMSYLPRSNSRKKDKQVMMRKKKRKYELGLKRPSWINIPEVFYLNRPDFVKNPFYKMSSLEYIKAIIQTPLKKIKRKIIYN
jgi:glycosyltransferase involved in cell wall biosynthesis